MALPTSQDYNEAIQHPSSCFTDAELRQTEAKCNAIGIPMPRSGNFADVYEMTHPSGKKWAVKCFTRAVAGLRERYAAISAHLKQANLPFTVDFAYQEQGIQVNGQWYPILKMDWVEGLTLNEFLRQNADNRSLLEATAQLWLKLARRLREARMAHCDLQHGNVLLVPGKRDGALSVKLIDYDGMFVPALRNTRSGEVGHPAFQHPQRLRDGTYSAEVDRFPHLVIYTALRALRVGGRAQWSKYDNGDNLLFKQADLEAPSRSNLFLELLKLNDPEVRGLTEALIGAAKQPLEQTPLLDELAGSSQTQAALPLKPRLKRRPGGPTRKRSLKVPVMLGAVLLALGGGWFAWNSRPKPNTPPAQPAPATPREAALLVVLPVADVTVKPGESTTLEIQVDRKDYHGPIILSLEGLPAEVTAPPVIIEPKERSGRIKLEAGDTADASATRVRIVARGGELSASREVQLTVPLVRSVVLLPLLDVTLKPGESKDLEVKVRRKEYEGPIQVTVEGLPDGVRAAPATIAARESTVQVRLTTATEAEAIQKRFQVLVKAGDLNARGEVRLSVSAPDVPTLLPIADVTLKPGESKNLKIEVNRNSFQGPIRVTLTGLPEKVTATATTIAAETNSVQVALTAAADAEGVEKPFHVVAVAGPRTAKSEVKLTVPAIALLPVADVSVKAGEEAVLEIKLERKYFKGAVRVTLDGLPDKVTVAPANIGENESAVKVKLSTTADATEVQRKLIRVVATADQLNAGSDLRLTIQKPVVVDKRARVPGDTAQDQAEKVIKDTFKADYDKLKTTADRAARAALAAKFMQQAADTKDDPVARFVLLRDAGDLFVQAGDMAAALKVVEQLGQLYAIDLPVIKLATLNGFYKSATTPALNRVLVESCLAVLEEAIAADNYGVAQRLLDLAEAASKKSGVPALLPRTQAHGKEVREAQKEYELAKVAAATLKQKPDDAQANLERGKYLCRRKGDWERGLPLLAKGADPDLQALALKDLAAPPEATEQAAVGDRWWDLAAKEQALAKAQLLRRAHSWYQRAAPRLSGLTKATVEKRIAEVQSILTASLAPASAFVSLFNGKDLTGWKTHPSQRGSWRVEKGVLIGGRPARFDDKGNLISSGSATSHLYTVRGDYKDFHLRVEARINDGGNSGVYFRTAFGPARPVKNPMFPLGYEAQINSTHRDANKTGSLVGFGPVVSVRESLVAAGTWFTEEVIVEGNHIIIKVNDKKTVDCFDEKQLSTRGHIGLQQWETQTVVEFRKIEIYELKPKKP